MSSNTHEKSLSLYAKTAVRVGLNLQKGQELIIEADIDASPLVRLVAREAYKAGASVVTPLYSDKQMMIERLNNADDLTLDLTNTWIPEAKKEIIEKGNVARIVIINGDTQLLKGYDKNKISRISKAAVNANRGVMELLSQGALNWNIIAYATPEWAIQVFPELSVNDALNKLWNCIFQSSRIYGDPITNWKKHNANLKQRAERLNELRFDSLHFKGPGTDIVIGLADGHNWAGGQTTTKTGITNNANIPTEEVFTTPHKDRVNGVVSSTKPLYFNGSVIDGIQVTFKDGKIISGGAKVGNDIFQKLLESDEGSRRIGEVALVPNSSPISATNILYKNTLFDENAACHIAIGRSYSKCMKDSIGLTQEELSKRGANDSVIHIDWMIGSGKIDVIGIKNGKKTPVMNQGEFCAELFED